MSSPESDLDVMGVQESPTLASHHQCSEPRPINVNDEDDEIEEVDEDEDEDDTTTTTTTDTDDFRSLPVSPIKSSSLYSDQMDLQHSSSFSDQQSYSSSFSDHNQYSSSPIDINESRGDGGSSSSPTLLDNRNLSSADMDIIDNDRNINENKKSSTGSLGGIPFCWDVDPITYNDTTTAISAHHQR